MKNSIKNLLYVIIFVSAALAQGNRSVIDQYGLSNSIYIQQSGEQNISSILQSGEFNSYEIIQDGTGNFMYYKDLGTPLGYNDIQGEDYFDDLASFPAYNIQNKASVRQIGKFNETLFFNTGINCEINVDQAGINNGYRSINIGKDNLFNVTQLGDRNVISQDIRVSAHEFTLYQEGSFNRIMHTDNSLNGFDIKIIQKGDWIKTIVRNGTIVN